MFSCFINIFCLNQSSVYVHLSLRFRVTLIQLQVSEVSSLGKSLGPFICSVESNRFFWEVIYSLA